MINHVTLKMYQIGNFYLGSEQYVFFRLLPDSAYRTKIVYVVLQLLCRKPL